MDHLSFRESASRDFHTCVCRGIPLVVRAAPPAASLVETPCVPRTNRPSVYATDSFLVDLFGTR